MTTPQDQNTPQSNEKANDKEYNFRMLEAKYQKQLAEERSARLEAERLAQERLHLSQSHEDDDDSDPYVDHKKLEKKLSRFGQNTQSDIQKAMEQAKFSAKEELKQELWLEQNPDFDEILHQHAQKFADKAPHLAATILKMPDNFERRKLVYQSIKELGIHNPPVATPSIQQKIDANRKSPYYQPSTVGTAPYAQVGDFSPQGQKNAYEKLQQLKANLRLG